MYVHITFRLSIPPPTDTWLLQRLVVIWWITQLCTRVCKYLFISLLSVLQGVYPEAGPWYKWCFYFRSFEGPPCCFPWWRHHFTSPPARHLGSNSSAPSPSLVFCFLNSSHPNRCEWYVLVVWFSISLMTSDAEHLFMCLFWSTPLEKYLSKSTARFFNWIVTIY